MTALNLAITYASLAAAGFYGIRWSAAAPSVARTACKTAAVGCLALLAWLGGGPALLVFALAASALGDLLLAGPGQKRFLAGVAAFAIAHGAYVPLFTAMGAWTEPLPLWRLLLMAALVVVAASLLFGVLWKRLGAMAWPLTGYFVIILAMGLSAWALPLTDAALIVAVGSTLFMISDMVLGWEMFVLEDGAPRRKLTGPIVWFCYYGGQALIWAGVMLAISSVSDVVG